MGGCSWPSQMRAASWLDLNDVYMSVGSILCVTTAVTALIKGVVGIEPSRGGGAAKNNEQQHAARCSTWTPSPPEQCHSQLYRLAATSQRLIASLLVSNSNTAGSIVRLKRRKALPIIHPCPHQRAIARARPCKRATSISRYDLCSGSIPARSSNTGGSPLRRGHTGAALAAFAALGAAAATAAVPVLPIQHGRSGGRPPHSSSYHQPRPNPALGRPHGRCSFPPFRVHILRRSSCGSPPRLQQQQHPAARP
jgi:hypothetical protein